MTLFSIAYRNVWRNGYRTAITVFAIGFSGGVMIFYSTLMVGLRSMMERNAVEMNLGKIQLHADGYRKDPDLYNRIKEVPDLIKHLEENGFHTAPRLYGVGLAAAHNNSSGVTLRGIDLIREPTVTQLHRHLQTGIWLDEKESLQDTIPGRAGVVIGSKLARTLSIAVGEEIVLVSQAADGSMANDLFVVRGILKATSEGIDRLGIFMEERAFRTLMALPEGTHEIAIMPKDNTIDLKQATAQVALLAPGLEVKNWRELQPAIARILDMNKVAFAIILLLAYLSVSLTALNSMLMAVFERIPEFGIMKAMGVAPRQIMMLVYMEAMIKTVGALLLAITIGFPIAFYTQKNGLDLSRLMKGATISGVAFDPIVYSKITLSGLVTPLWVLIAVVALSVIYPSIKAAIIEPVEAIRHQ